MRYGYIFCSTLLRQIFPTKFFLRPEDHTDRWWVISYHLLISAQPNVRWYVLWLYPIRSDLCLIVSGHGWGWNYLGYIRSTEALTTCPNRYIVQRSRAIEGVAFRVFSFLFRKSRQFYCPISFFRLVHAIPEYLGLACSHPILPVWCVSVVAGSALFVADSSLRVFWTVCRLWFVRVEPLASAFHRAWTNVLWYCWWWAILAFGLQITEYSHLRNWPNNAHYLCSE